MEDFMKIKATRSRLPLAFGLVGGILAIVGGMCLYALGSCVDAIEEAAELTTKYGTVWTICGLVGLVVGIVAIVAGCLAKNNAIGSLLLTICGLIVVVLVVVQSVTQGEGVNLWNTIASVFMLVGGIVGMCQPKEEIVSQ